MVDEFNAFDAGADWIPPKVDASNLDTFIAVEPSSWSKFNEERKTKDSDTMIKFLPTKHRNAKVIDQFLTGVIKEKGGFKDTSEDQAPLKLYHHLDERHDFLPDGEQPIWINFEQLSMEDLQYCLKELTKEFGNKVIVISRLNLKPYRVLCEKMNWKYRRVEDIIGTESRCLITIGLPSHQNLEEILSRARNKLIIVTEEKR